MSLITRENLGNLAVQKPFSLDTEMFGMSVQGHMSP